MIVQKFFSEQKRSLSRNVCYIVQNRVLDPVKYIAHIQHVKGSMQLSNCLRTESVHNCT